MARKALRCVLRLEIRAITCPGVQLKDKEELYLSVSLLGQYKKTRCVPAAFPLFFQERLVFEKTFADIVDPADLVKLLEFDTTVLELIQLVPPGEILATYEENTRDFLFPDPKITRRHHGLDREILMKRSSSFTIWAQVHIKYPFIEFKTEHDVSVEYLRKAHQGRWRSSVNEIHLCPKMRTAEASVTVFHLHQRKSEQFKKGFSHTDPIFGNNKEAVFDGSGGRLSKSTCGSSPWLPNGIAVRGFLPTEEVRSQMSPSSSVPKALLGIAPKLRFSTSSLITESLLSSGRSHIQDDLNWAPHSTPNGKLQTKLPKKITLSPEKSRHSIVTKNYEQPTIASKSRSPSPYTKRRMCELSEEARQRLAHLNLGPYEFRRETDKPPFVVRRVEQPSPGIELHAWCTLRESTIGAWSKVTHDPSLLGSYKPKRAQAKPTHGKDCDSSSDICIEDVILGPPNRQSRSAGSLVRSAPSAFQKHSPSSVLNRSSLRERFNSGCPPPANGDEIHKRVKNILRTHSARQRLVFNESNSSKGALTKTRDSSHKAHLSMSELHSSSPVQRNTTVHLDNGEYWSSRAAVYKGKSHRAIFEESLEKIYRNMYRNASGTVSDQKPHS